MAPSPATTQNPSDYVAKQCLNLGLAPLGKIPSPMAQKAIQAIGAVELAKPPKNRWCSPFLIHLTRRCQRLNLVAVSLIFQPPPTIGSNAMNANLVNIWAKTDKDAFSRWLVPRKRGDEPLREELTLALVSCS